MTDADFELAHVSKRFGGLQAVDDVSITLHRGVIHGLIGPNGAGKTTLINLATGTYRPDSGTVRLAGRDIKRLAPHRRARLGLARTFQSARLFDHLTVLQNVEIALAAPRRGTRRHGGERRPRDLLAEIGMDEREHTRLAAELPHGSRKLLEVAWSVHGDPAVLLLDEPAAGLDDREIQVLTELLSNHSRQIAVLIIEHNMDVISAVCDTVTVLDSGRYVVSGTPESVMRDPAVIEAYLGLA